MAGVLMQPTATLPGEVNRARRASRWWDRFLRQPTAVTGLTLLLAIASVAFLAPWLAPGNPLSGDGPPLQAPSPQHPLGSDDLGRDILSQLLHGARVSLFVGLAVAVIATLVGVLVGGVAGFFGRWVDDGLMRLTEFVMVLPRFFLAIIVTTFFGGSLLNIVLLLGMTFWPSTARLLRAQILSLREREFVVAARRGGHGAGHLDPAGAAQCDAAGAG